MADNAGQEHVAGALRRSRQNVDDANRGNGNETHGLNQKAAVRRPEQHNGTIRTRLQKGLPKG